MVRALVVFALLLVSLPVEAGRGTALLKYAPDDATVVMIVDAARARRSPFYKKAFDLLREKRADFDTLAEQVPGLDKSIDTIFASGNTEQGSAVFVFEGKLDKLVAAIKKQATKEDKHAGITIWTLPDTGEAALIDKKLVVTNAGQMTSAIDRVANKKAKGPATLRTIVANAPPNSTMFGGVIADSSMRKDVANDLGAEPQWIGFSCGMAQKLTFDGKIKLADDASAEKVTKALNEKLGLPGSDGTLRSRLEGFVGKDFSDSIVVDQDHTFSRVTATMTGEEVDKLLTLAKMFM